MTTELLDSAAQPQEAEAQASLPLEQPAAETGAPATASADNPPAAESESLPEYQPFKLPEGMAMDDEISGEFVSEAKRLKLSQEDAQKLADLGAKVQVKQMQAYQKTQQQWVEASKTDQEFGGEKLTENLGVAKKALESFATPQLRKLLNETGFGNHPEVVRMFYRVGKAISEDGRVVTGTKAGIPSDPAKRLFPNQA